MISNAVETFEVSMRNEGYMSHEIRCLFPELPPVAGYAERAGAPPISNLFYDQRTDWWEYVASCPAPSILAFSDVDHAPGIGAFVGEIQAEIGRAPGCVDYVTNGVVRDIPALERNRFQCFATGVAISHSYAHIVEFGDPVEIGCLKVEPGDILQGDRHGVQSIPGEVASRLPQAVPELLKREEELIRLCRKPDFSIGKLTEILDKDASCPPRNRR